MSGKLAAELRFGDYVTATYVAWSLALPVLWIAALWLAGGYDARFVGSGSDEFRRVFNSGISLTAATVTFSYTINIQLSRGYLLIALPYTMLFDLVARYALRKRLHRRRASGGCVLSVVAVGHEAAVADLVVELRRDRYHGLTVVAACVAQRSARPEVAGVPVYGGLDDITYAVLALGADTVAALACPEMDGVRLRTLAWELEKTGTDLCVSPTLLDFAGSPDHDPVYGRAHPHACGSPATERCPPGYQERVRQVRGRSRPSTAHSGHGDHRCDDLAL